MAKTALERALPYSDENDFPFLNMAAHICRATGEYQAALSHINKAILIAPDLADLYITKAQVFEAFYMDDLKVRSNDAALHLRQARETMRIASEKAVRQGDTAAQARADGALAFLLYYNEPRDVATAEKLAIRALENGDSFGNAKRVLDDLAKSREDAEKAAKLEQERRAELERKKADERERQAKLEQERQHKLQAMEDKKKKVNSLYVLGWIAIALSFVLFFMATSISSALFSIVVAYCSAALFNFADSFKNGYSSTPITAISLVLALSYSFKTATAAYNLLGHSAASAGRTWIIFAILFAVFLVIIFVAKAFGKRADSMTRFK